MSDKLSDEQIECALEAYLLELQTHPLNTEAMRNSSTWPRISRGMQFSAMREALLAASPAPAISARYRWLCDQAQMTDYNGGNEGVWDIRGIPAYSTWLKNPFNHLTFENAVDAARKGGKS